MQVLQFMTWPIGAVCVTLLDMDKEMLDGWTYVDMEQTQKDMISTCLFGDGNLMDSVDSGVEGSRAGDLGGSENPRRELDCTDRPAKRKHTGSKSCPQAGPREPGREQVPLDARVHDPGDGEARAPDRGGKHVRSQCRIILRSSNDSLN